MPVDPEEPRMRVSIAQAGAKTPHTFIEAGGPSTLIKFEDFVTCLSS
jgi:hypothetical protein